jgi:protein phosphatase
MSGRTKATARREIPALYKVEPAFLSETGPRQANEDCAAVVVPRDSAIIASKGVLAVVADGMGGHKAGEIASRTAVAAIVETYCAGAGPIQQALARAFQEGNRRIFEHALREPELEGMGTTCTVLVVQGGFAWSAHVGDSRIYLIRAGCAYRMTEDHSATMQLVDQGLLTLEQASRHEHRNLILRAMGTHAELEVATWSEPFPIHAGDCFVLCTDGLYDVTPDEEIGRLANTGATPAEACRALVDAALARTSTDNITVAVVRIAAGT